MLIFIIIQIFLLNFARNRDIEMCVSYPNYFFANYDKEKLYKFNCHRLKCPECGPGRAKWLYKMIIENISKFDRVRMWTFTLSSMYFEKKVHYKIMNLALKYFTTYARRNTTLNDQARNFSYIKVTEVHKSLYAHFHIFVNVYLDWHFIQFLWSKSLKLAIKKLKDEIVNFEDIWRVIESKKISHVNVSAGLNSKKAAAYVTKYVTKSVEIIQDHIKRFYSKSRDVKFSVKVKRNGEVWGLIKVKEVSRSYLNLLDISISSQHKAFFQDNQTYFERTTQKMLNDLIQKTEYE